MLRRIPIVQSLTSFDAECHAVARKKFLILWFFSFLPILFAAGTSSYLAKHPNELAESSSSIPATSETNTEARTTSVSADAEENSTSAMGTFWTKLKVFFASIFNTFCATDPFIYAASFLSPMIYLIVEKYTEQRQYIGARRQSPDRLSTEPTGFLLTLMFTFLLYVTTAYIYGIAKAGDAQNNEYPIPFFFGLFIYLYAMFCWYFVILDSVDRESDFVRENRQREEEAINSFSQRVGGSA